MFGRSPNSDQKSLDQTRAPGAQPAPSDDAPTMILPASSSSQASPAPAAGSRSSTVIGTDVAIVGQKITVVAQSRVQIDGNIDGDVNGKEVIIGQTGRVNGTITANSIDVRGEVAGAIRANTVTLHPTARVDGDIFHQTLAIAEGAQFDGRVRRPKDASELTPNLDIASLRASIAG